MMEKMIKPPKMKRALTSGCCRKKVSVCGSDGNGGDEKKGQWMITNRRKRAR